MPQKRYVIAICKPIVAVTAPVVLLKRVPKYKPLPITNRTEHATGRRLRIIAGIFLGPAILR